MRLQRKAEGLQQGDGLFDLAGAGQLDGPDDRRL
jgi:hypothetical protein